MYKIYLLILLSCINCSVNAVLIKFDRLINGGFEIDLLSEFHNANEEDQQQVKIFERLVIEHDQKNQNDIHLLIEQPSQLCRMFRKDPKVTTDLIDIIKEAQMQKVKAEGIEIRCISGAANYLLEPTMNPNTIDESLQYNAHNRWCCVRDITFNDVANEFLCYVKELNQMQKIYSEDIKTLFDEKMRDAQEEFKWLQNALRDFKINQHDSILEVSKKLYKERNSQEHDRRHTLFYRLLNAFSPLFELQIFNRIMQVQRNAQVQGKSIKIVAIMGLSHTDSIRSMLCLSGAQYIASYGKIAQIKPLKPEDLRILASEKYSYWQQCLLV